MSISLREAYKNITSDAYNKENLKVFFVLILSGAILNAFSAFKESGYAATITAMGLYGLIMLYGIGLCNIASHNIFRKKPSVLPHVVNDAEKIAKTTVLSFGGSLLLVVGFTAAICTILGILALIAHTLGLNDAFIIILCACVFVILLFFSMILATSLFACFISNLEFTQWFNFKLAFKIIKNHFNSICYLYLKQILIFLACFGVMIGVMIPIAVLLVICFSVISLYNPDVYDKASAVLPVIGNFTGVITGSVGTLFGLDIAGQFTSEVLSEDDVKQKEDLKQEKIIEEEYIKKG